MWLGGLGLLCFDCLVTCRLDLWNVDLVVGLAYKLIKSNALVELHTRHTFDHVPSIGLSIIPIVVNALVDGCLDDLYIVFVGFLLTLAPILQDHFQPMNLLVFLL